MILRSVDTIRFFFLAASLVPSHAEDQLTEKERPPSVDTVFSAKVTWPDHDEALPAVCVTESGWYLCVSPLGQSQKRRAQLSSPILNLDGEEVETQLLHYDEKNQLCLLECVTSQSERAATGRDTPIRFANSSICQPGAPLKVHGLPQECRSVVTGKDLHYFGQKLPMPMLRVRLEKDNICQPGTPLLNEQGEIVALLAAHELDQSKGLAHAIPAATLKKLVMDFQGHQKTGPVWIGALFPSGDTTLEVVEVREDSPASRAKVKVGDVVIAVNQQAVNSFPELEEALLNLPAEIPAIVEVLRDWEKISLQVVPEFKSKKQRN